MIDYAKLIKLTNNVLSCLQEEDIDKAIAHIFVLVNNIESEIILSKKETIEK